MDYKEALKMFEWMAVNTKLSGMDARVLIFMTTNSGYKTSEFSGSYETLASSLKTTKQSILISIKRLEKCGAISKQKSQIGRTPAIYKIRTVDNMRTLHETEVRNILRESWDIEHDRLFLDIENRVSDIGYECPDCKENKMCDLHQFKKKQLMDTPEYRAMVLWESDHKPKPDAKTKTVKFIDIGKL